MVSDRRSRSGARPDRSTNYRGDTDREEAAVLVEAFLERDLLPASVTEEVSRHHAAGNYPEALQLILETRRNRRLS